MTTTPEVHVTQPAAVKDVASLKVSQPSTIVIFGATGDLAARKLIPAFYNLYLQGLLSDQSTIVGVARRDMTDDQHRLALREAVGKYSRIQPVSDDAWNGFTKRICYHRVRFDEPMDYAGLARRLEDIDRRRGTPGQRLFYLAVEPSYFLPILQMLHTVQLTEPCHPVEAVRVVFEKPFGRDLESARTLTREITAILDEDQIYRIDHYLGKDTVQNILSFRFGNSIFEPLFNTKYVNHVQITVAETIGMEGRRGGYYDTSGAIRDIIQNHGLQLLCLVAMEPPAVFGPKEIRDEKVKVLQSLRRPTLESVRHDVVRGQYLAGRIEDQAVQEYRHEEGVQPGSQTETYVAMRMAIDNWRWAGVPFFLRTGKRLARRATEISVQFKEPPLQFFTTVECVGDVCDIARAKPNVLTFRIQPNEGISLTFAAKQPGMLFTIHEVEMDFLYNRSFAMALPEAYERLLLDALRGDSTLFTRSDEVEFAWRYVDPILRAWTSQDPPPLFSYDAGTWGPREANFLFQPQEGGRRLI